MRKITLSAILVLISTFSFAATGWFSDFLTISVNGASTPNNYFLTDATPASGATALNAKVFGLVSELTITGADMKYWADGGDVRTGSAFYYKITNETATFEYVAATEVIMDQVSIGGNDYQGTKATTINLLAGLPYGTYKLHVWAKSWGDPGGDSYLSNSGANYVATFTKIPAVGTPLSGTLKVGDALDANFNTLGSAVMGLNTYGLGGNVILEIASDITEGSNVGLGVNTNGFSVLIRPNADVDRTITFTRLADNTSPTGHFVIGYTTSGLTVAWSNSNLIPTNNVTIDGYAVGGTTKRLTFTNTNASHTAARVIVVVGACQNTVVKNCIINNLTTSTSSPFCIGAVVRKVGTLSTDAEFAPNGLTIENNTLTATGNVVAMGARITSSNTPLTAKLTGLVFKNNIVTSRRRLFEINYTTGGEISGNQFTSLATGAAGSVSYGLWTATGVDGTIKIHNNKFLKSFTEETGAYGHRVISLGSGATYEIFNNTFAGMDKTKASTAALNLTYLFYSGVAGKIYNNTFYMPALTDATHTGGYYRAINLSGNTAEIKNNIFISAEPTHTNTSFISAVPTPASDNNIFYIRQAHTGATVVGTYVTLGDYQTANLTKDAASKSVDVTFENAATGDLRIAGLSVQDNQLRVPSLAAVTTDILGTVRNTEFTYAGAHESTLPFLTTDVDNGVEEQARILRTMSGIEVQLNREANIELYTINGMLIEKARMNGTYTRNLNSGIYIIRIDGIATKFIK